MTEGDGYGRCNRCGAPLGPDAEVRRAFSGAHPYEHAEREQCLPSEPLQVVRALWSAFAVGGIDGSLSLAPDYVEWAPFSAAGLTLRGHRELQAWRAETERAGRFLAANPYAFDRRGEAILVSGHLRLVDRHGVENHELHWVYRFDRGRLWRAESYVSRAAALAASVD